jgi:hypothetical protein
MNYAELVQAVVDITDRDELVPQIQYAISKATLKFHLADFWLRDLVEKKITADVVDGQRNEIYVSSSLEGFRAIQYINGWDDTVTPGAVMQQFTENSPATIRDQYGIRKWDVYYLAGDVLTLWASFVPPKFLISYWTMPKVDKTNYNSWIADIAPFAIVDEASVEIFGSVGDADEAVRRAKMFLPNLQLVRTNSTTAVGA